jgi:hypothetical protein
MEEVQVQWNTTGEGEAAISCAVVVIPFKSAGARNEAIKFLRYLRELSHSASDGAAAGEILECSRGDVKYIKLSILLPVKALYSRLPQLTGEGSQHFRQGYQAKASFALK